MFGIKIYPYREIVDGGDDRLRGRSILPTPPMEDAHAKHLAWYPRRVTRHIGGQEIDVLDYFVQVDEEDDPCVLLDHPEDRYVRSIYDYLPATHTIGFGYPPADWVTDSVKTRIDAYPSLTMTKQPIWLEDGCATGMNWETGRHTVQGQHWLLYIEATMTISVRRLWGDWAVPRWGLSVEMGYFDAGGVPRGTAAHWHRMGDPSQLWPRVINPIGTSDCGGNWQFSYDTSQGSPTGTGPFTYWISIGE